MSSQDISLDQIISARERISPYIEQTPLIRIEEAGLWLKCENRQRTGSFKLRGALNKILGLEAEALRSGLVAASAGNHGQGVAYAASLRNVPATIVVPQDAVGIKVQAIRALGAEVIKVDGGYARAEEEGKRLAQETGAVWVSAYNDQEVIAGQGTIGVELVEELGLSTGTAGLEFYIPVGGGGLISGIGLALRHIVPSSRIIGVQPEASPYLYAHFRGEEMDRVDERPTLADGLAGAVEKGSITLDIVRQVVDDMILVSEDAIENAILWAMDRAGELVEPSAAAALAASLDQEGTERRVVVLSGGNIDRSLLARIRKKARNNAQH